MIKWQLSSASCPTNVSISRTTELWNFQSFRTPKGEDKRVGQTKGSCYGENMFHTRTRSLKVRNEKSLRKCAGLSVLACVDASLRIHIDAMVFIFVYGSIVRRILIHLIQNIIGSYFNSVDFDSELFTLNVLLSSSF